MAGCGGNVPPDIDEATVTVLLDTLFTIHLGWSLVMIVMVEIHLANVPTHAHESVDLGVISTRVLHFRELTKFHRSFPKPTEINLGIPKTPPLASQ